MTDFSWIGQVASAGGAIYSTAKQGQIAADSLNKQSEINDRTWAFKNYQTQQIIRAGTIVAVLLVVYLIVKKFI